MTAPEPIFRCELCGEIVAEPPEDTSGDVLCGLCLCHLRECGMELGEVATT